MQRRKKDKFSRVRGNMHSDATLRSRPAWSTKHPCMCVFDRVQGKEEGGRWEGLRSLKGWEAETRVGRGPGTRSSTENYT